MVFQSRSASIRRRRIALSRTGGLDHAADAKLELDGAPDADTGDDDLSVLEETDAPGNVSSADGMPSQNSVDTDSVHYEGTVAGEVEAATVDEDLTSVLPPEIVAGTPHVPASTVDFDQDWRPLLSLLDRSRPLAWLFAGSRPGATEDQTALITGEEFGKRWRAIGNRHTDVIIDATWPGASLSHLWSNLSERVLRFRPDIALVFLGDADARSGMSHLSRFERQLEATITRMRKEHILPVLIPIMDSADTADIDAEVYAEAVNAIAKEREILILGNSGTPRTPETVADDLCHFLTRLMHEHLSAT